MKEPLFFLFIKEGNQFLPQEFAQFDTQYLNMFMFNKHLFTT